jgi:hypothetical protein
VHIETTTFDNSPVRKLSQKIWAVIIPVERNKFDTSHLRFLQEPNLNLTHNNGCLKQNATGTYERFIISRRNRFNRTVNFVNASIYALTISFADASKLDGYSSMFEAGLNPTTILTFPVDFPSQDHTTGNRTLMQITRPCVINFIVQYGRVQRFWGFPQPELTGSALLAPKC